MVRDELNRQEKLQIMKIQKRKKEIGKKNRKRKDTCHA